MSSLRDLENAEIGGEITDDSHGSWAVCLPFHTATLKPGATVFQIGDPKRAIYRVDSGTIGISEAYSSGCREPVEEIGSGTVFGLGFLDEHVYDAVALCDSTVSCWSKEALPFLEALDPAVGRRQTLETEREFLHRRRTLTALAPKTPHGLLAGFLCVASRLNESQGRDADLIDDTVDCASVAAFLKLDLASLQKALVELRNRGLVAHEPPRGLRIIDRAGLQSLAEDENAQHVGIGEGANA